jgi:hypothetical protein
MICREIAGDRQGKLKVKRRVSTKALRWEET